MVWQLGVTGILVLDAKEGGPAWKAGIHGTKRDDWGRLVYGDIITEFQGTRIRFVPTHVLSLGCSACLSACRLGRGNKGLLPCASFCGSSQGLVVQPPCCK